MKLPAANDSRFEQSQYDMDMDRDALLSESVFRKMYGFDASADQRAKVIRLKRELDLTVRSIKIIKGADALHIPHDGEAYILFRRPIYMLNIIWLIGSLLFVIYFSFFPAVYKIDTFTKMLLLMLCASPFVVSFNEAYKRTFMTKGILSERSIKIGEKRELSKKVESSENTPETVFNIFSGK